MFARSLTIYEFEKLFKLAFVQAEVVNIPIGLFQKTGDFSPYDNHVHSDNVFAPL